MASVEKVSFSRSNSEMVVSSNDQECLTVAKGEKMGVWRRIAVYSSLIGTSIGFGTLWRFPTETSKFGGLSYLLIFMFVTVVISFPALVLEVSVGQLGQSTLFDFSILTNNRRHAVVSIAFITAVVFFFYYSTLLMWVSSYLFHSVSQPWYPSSDALQQCRDVCSGVECDLLGTVDCLSTVIEGAGRTQKNIDAGHYLKCSVDFLGLCVGDIMDFSTQYFTSTIPQNFEWLRPDIFPDTYNKVHTISWELYGYLCMSAVLAFVVSLFGKRILGYVSYGTIGPAFVCMIGLFIYTWTIPGAVDGIKFFAGTFDASHLYSADAWKSAVVQSAFACSIGMYLVPTLSSASAITEPTGVTALTVVISIMVSSLMSGCIVFGMLGNLSAKTGIPVEHLQGNGGAGLVFITYGAGLSDIDEGGMISATVGLLFWLMFFLMGFSSFMNLNEGILLGFWDPRMKINSCLPSNWNLHYCYATLFLVLQVVTGILNASDCGLLLVDVLDSFNTYYHIPISASVLAYIVAWDLNGPWYVRKLGRNVANWIKVGVLSLVFLGATSPLYMGEYDGLGSIGFGLFLPLICGTLIFPFIVKLQLNMTFSEAFNIVFSGYYGEVMLRFAELVHLATPGRVTLMHRWVAGLTRWAVFPYMAVTSGISLVKYEDTFLMRSYIETASGLSIEDMPNTRDPTYPKLPGWILFCGQLFLCIFVCTGIISYSLPAVVELLHAAPKYVHGILMREDSAFGAICTEEGDRDDTTQVQKRLEKSSTDTESSSGG